MTRPKVLLDECVDRRFARALPDHEVQSVASMGWSGIKNGDLISRAAAQFDCLITVDQGMPFQHDLGRFDIALLVLRAKTNRLQDLLVLAPDVLAALASIKAGTVAGWGLTAHLVHSARIALLPGTGWDEAASLLGQLSAPSGMVRASSLPARLPAAS